MGYIPPPSWPPPANWRPPFDDWTPPEFWQPGRGIPMTPDGDLYLLPPIPGEAAPVEPTAEEQDAIHLRRVTRMLSIWAREVQRAAHSYYQATVKAEWTDRAIEYMEDWSPTEANLREALEESWVRGYQLVMAAHQMEQWLAAYRVSGGETSDEGEFAEDKELERLLRNTIEHLSDARFTEAAAWRNPADTKRKSPSIEKLPGGGLFLGFRPSNHELVFGLVEVKKLFERAKRYAYVDTPREDSEFEPSDIDYENMGYRGDAT
ncbi:hypothetical protein [Actinoplanes sp. SE50/110]|uniref:hypothetical protein n=2 Tax=unclassified Actinoplanes TaxID=2626549 RepID=UPI0012BAEFD7|nr:hypothetical protein [Actinoplanes sp. SE50/110]